MRFKAHAYSGVSTIAPLPNGRSAAWRWSMTWRGGRMQCASRRQRTTWAAVPRPIDALTAGVDAIAQAGLKQGSLEGATFELVTPRASRTDDGCLGFPLSRK